jgi:hypothetical protein
MVQWCPSVLGPAARNAGKLNLLIQAAHPHLLCVLMTWTMGLASIRVCLATSKKTDGVADLNKVDPCHVTNK